MLVRLILFALAVIAPLLAQWSGSGSTGADGVLNLVTPGTVLFDPKAFNPPLNPANDNIFNFASIYIAKGVTVKLSAQKLGGPIFWLAEGPVIIDGTIDLNGSDGETRLLSVPGAGGFAGGAAENPGYRPTSFTPNMFLVPLVGGFGGDGGTAVGGGAGGGALLIASSTSITIGGSIMANGGASLGGLGGGGGAIRLVAPTIGGPGILLAKGGQPQGAAGRVRFETLRNEFEGTLSDTPYSEGKPFGLYLPARQSAVQILSVEPVQTEKSKSKEGQTVNIAIEGRYLAPGRSVRVRLFMEDGTSQLVTSSPLVGTFDRSRGSIFVTLPKSSSGGIVRAEWNQPESGEPPK